MPGRNCVPKSACPVLRGALVKELIALITDLLQFIIIAVFSHHSQVAVFLYGLAR